MSQVSQAPAIVTAAADDFPRVSRIDELAFGYTRDDDEPSSSRDPLEMDRTRIAVLGGVDAGLSSVYSLEMSLPGVVRQSIAGLTWVGVLPTLRRRGVLSALIRAHFEDLHDGGLEPISGLWAAEPGIYGRFGYGLASTRLRLTIPREYARLTRPLASDAPTAQFADGDEVQPALASIEASVAASRPGVIARTTRWWDRLYTDWPKARDGASALRTLLVSDDAGPRGYAIYRTKGLWGPRGAAGQVVVREVLALDIDAHNALWRTLLGTDLMTTVDYWNLAVDDPLLQHLPHLRAAEPVRDDALFVRLVDVDRALAARRYATEVDAVIELTDRWCPWNSGRWRLSGGPDGATCSSTTDSPDVRVEAGALAAAYLGGTSLQVLADAGLVDEVRPAALGALAHAFAAPRAPWCQLVF